MTTLFATLLVAALSLAAGQEAIYPFTVSYTHALSSLAATCPCWNFHAVLQVGFIPSTTGTQHERWSMKVYEHVAGIDS